MNYMNYGKVMTKEEFTKAILLRQRKRRIAEEKKKEWEADQYRYCDKWGGRKNW